MPEKKPIDPKADKAEAADKPEADEKPTPLVEEEPVESSHRITVGGKSLAYKVTAGMLPLKDAKGEIEANVFFVAYTLNGTKDPARRPLMFSFNGGPGSSSVWLHLGALGPKRVQMLPDGGLPAPPYRLVDNPETWLTETDIVFIDPVGTGYSRAATEDLGKKFWSLKGDIESMGEFIRLYLTRYLRWASPLFLVGESYGTTRSAGLAGHLIDKGIAFNGLLLISSILNFQTADFSKGNDLPYHLFLPTYCATAWFHKQLPGKKKLAQVLREVQQWVDEEYPRLLGLGDRLIGSERTEAVERMVGFTGLSPEFIDRADLRLEIRAFCKELLRDERRTVGRLDSRFKGLDANPNADKPDYDPSMTGIRPPYTAMFNDYVRRELGYKTDVPYFILGGGFEKWDWGPAEKGHPDTSEALRQAFAKNPHMRLFIASGYYDLATPYYATEYTLNHMGLDPSVRGNITVREYEAGHMMYINEPCLRELKQHATEFIGGSWTLTA
jgi:carboxypeptidase C (cathepsin A)